MGHLIIHAFRWKLRNFACVFWPLVFPILLGSLFFFSMGNIGNAESMQEIPVAVVVEAEAEETPYFEGFLKQLTQGDDAMLSAREYSREEAEAALAEQTVDGIFFFDGTARLIVAKSNLNASILETMLQVYTDYAELLKTTMDEHPERFPQVMEAIQANHCYAKTVSLGGNSLEMSTPFYYALIAMACLYGGFIGVTTSMRLQANITPLGARRCITPTHKMKLILAELGSAVVMHLVNLTFLLLVLRYVYRVPLGGSLGNTLLISAFGVLIGVCSGFFIGAAVKGGEELKIGLVNCFSLVSSFLAGLMATQVKDSVESACPLIRWVNPATLISDALYAVHIYNDPGRMMQCFAMLGGISAMLAVGSFLVTRRERYASI